VEASALSHPVGLTRVALAGPLLRLRSDDQLVALFRAGHDEAFGAIHERYRARLFAYARQMLGGSRSDAEDVLQDVFLRAYNALRTDRREVALRAWLYRVAHNRCIDQLRRPAPAAEDIFDVNRGSAGEQPAEAYERREDLRRLVEDVRALPEQQRSALLMREMEGLSYNDLAAALGVTVPAIKSLLVRARIGLVEAVEARDTACVEIRDDLVSAFDRGVRVSGRAKKHLKECDGCRQYRTALRGVEKQLNGLAPSHGPLALVAKVLGLGGAGSGGGAFALGGGGAAAGAGAGATVGTAAVTTGGMATLGGGAVATKVVAVVAAAAVVGGGAATVKQVEHAVQPARHAPVARTAAAPAPAPLVASKAARDDVGTTVRHAAPASGGGHEGAAATTHAASATRMASTADSASTAVAPTLEPTSGGLEAPGTTADATSTTETTAAGTATGDPSSTTTATGTGTTTGAGSTAATTDQGATGTPTTSTTTAPTTTPVPPASTAATTTTGGRPSYPGGTVAPSSAAPSTPPAG